MKAPTPAEPDSEFPDEMPDELSEEALAELETAIQRRQRRRLVTGLAVVGLLLALVGGYAGYWFWAAGAVEKGTTDWIAQAERDGLVVRYETLQVSGFPFHMVLRMDQPRAAAPRAPQPWSWGSRRLIARARPWNLNWIHVDAAGAQGVTLTVEGRDIHYTGDAGRLEADVGLRDGRVVGLDVRVADLGLDAPAPFGPVSAGRIEADVRRPETGSDQDVSMTLRLNAREVAVSEGLNLPLGSRLGHIALSAEMRGPLPEPPNVGKLTAWRDAGGTIEVDSIGLDYGPLSLRGEGTVALDGALQPVGAMTAKIRGFFEAVDALRARGMIRSKAASTAKIVLGVMAKKPPEGGAASLSLPLTVQDRKLYVGPVPFVDFPPVRWSGEQNPVNEPAEPPANSGATG